MHYRSNTNHTNQSLGSVSIKPGNAMPPADGLVGRRTFVGGLGDAGSGTARGPADGGVFSKGEFPPRVKEEPRSSNSVIDQPAPQEQQQQQQRREQEQEHQHQHQQQQQQQQQQQPRKRDNAPRQRAGRTGGWSTRICNEPGCSTVPSYGAPGTKRQFCLQHAKPGMINVASKKCGVPGEPCGKVATYGVPGGKRERCAVHAEKNMVDIFNRKCLVSGCHLRATFGDEGGKRERCAKHTENGMVNFNRRRCAARGCLEVASHGVHKGRKQMFCVDHADREMVSIGNKKCSHPGCTLAALHAPGGGTGPHEVCARHADVFGGDKTDKPAVVRKKRGPYKKRVYHSSLAAVESNQGAKKRGRPAGAAAAAAAAFPDARRKRSGVNEHRQARAGTGNTEPSRPSAAGKESPRSLRLLLQTDDHGGGWAVLDWNWKAALDAAQSVFSSIDRAEYHPCV